MLIARLQRNFLDILVKQSHHITQIPVCRAPILFARYLLQPIFLKETFVLL